MTENDDLDMMSPLEIKQEAIDIYEEFADNEYVLKALREGATTVKLEDSILDLPINDVIQEDKNVFTMKLRSRKKPKSINEINDSELNENIKFKPANNDEEKTNDVDNSGTNKKDTIKENGLIKKNTSKAKKSYYNAKDKYKCDMCAFFCQHAKKLKKHKQAKHKKYQCNYCPYQTTSEVLFEPHIFKHRFTRPFVCDICSMDFKAKVKLARHMQTHQQIRKYKCPDCPLAFVEKYNLTSHRNTHIEIFPYKCHLCFFKSKYKGSLKDHLLSHAGVRMYSCDLCSFKSITRSGMKSHTYSHTNERPHGCFVCPYKAKIKCKLDRHISSVHTMKTQLVCEHCNYTTFCQDKLDIHNETHNADSFYPCIICFYIFKKKSNLKKHLERHKLLKDLKCSECSMKECCEKHKHFDANLYVCNLCSKRFHRKDAIKIHMAQYHLT